MIKKFFSERKLNIICSVAAILIMWLAWIIAYICVKNDYIVPSFKDTVYALWQCLKESAFWTAFFWTLLRTLIAFIISFALAAACAAFAAASKVFSAILKPFMTVLRTLPTLAVILLILVWSNAKIAPVIVTVLVLFPLIYAQFNAALGEIDDGIIKMCEVYSVKKSERLFKIYLPLVSPNIFSQTGANISLGLKVLISAEVLSNTYKSLGGMMQTARAFVEMPRLAALTIVAVLLGLMLDVAFSQLRRITSKWSGGKKND